MTLLLASANADVGMAAGRDLLLAGASALDAVEAVVRAVEANAADHTVGYGGFPNIVGDVELDASVMDGGTRAAGAVVGVRTTRHPLTLARAVMERLPHVMLAGAGADRFAREIGLAEEPLLTDEAERIWRHGVETYAVDLDGPLAEGVRTLVLDPEHVTGTVNVIAIDADGRLASAVSTSGWAWKYPGRTGDTGCIGAGNYADARAGAATCTGWGELAIRSGAARGAVEAMRRGATAFEAVAAVLRDLPDPGMGDGDVPFHMLSVRADGSHAAVSTTSTSRYAVWEPSLAAPQVRPREQVEPGGTP
ncbi:MAG TPA: isoaspartyl peptidase/L-asparaginase [Mycobacteriales bacterium]|jgi:beta-aspartyl-peptidase (threonine type)|nr:isoaspartyl peptidase/L-asparaginase [Mycobacteriales bacterium]